MVRNSPKTFARENVLFLCSGVGDWERNRGGPSSEEESISCCPEAIVM